MANRTIECGECGESVPYGRLSCPACGALLAAVTRASRSSNGASAAGRRHARFREQRSERAGRRHARVLEHARCLAEGGRSGFGAGLSHRSRTGRRGRARPRVVAHALAAARRARAGRRGYGATTPPSLRRTTSLGTRPYGRGSSARTADPPRVPPPGAYLPPSSAASIALTTGVGRPAPSLGGPGVSDPSSATTRPSGPPCPASMRAGWVSSPAGSSPPGRRWPRSGSCCRGRSRSSAPAATAATSTAGAWPARPTSSRSRSCCSRLPWVSSRRPSRPGCERACSGSRSAACSSG